MVSFIKQRVIVGAGGQILLSSPELQEGELAEVIVTVERAPTSMDRVAGLHKLRDMLGLTRDSAAAWESKVHAERMAATVKIRP